MYTRKYAYGYEKLKKRKKKKDYTPIDILMV